MFAEYLTIFMPKCENNIKTKYLDIAGFPASLFFYNVNIFSVIVIIFTLFLSIRIHKVRARYFEAKL
jgi:hypothetical protein